VRVMLPSFSREVFTGTYPTWVADFFSGRGKRIKREGPIRPGVFICEVWFTTVFEEVGLHVCHQIMRG